MGFSLERARSALLATGGNLARAVDMLVVDDRLPSGMPRKWAERLAREPAYLEDVVRGLITMHDEKTAERFRNDPAIVVRDAGLDPAEFDIAGVRARVAELRGRSTSADPIVAAAEMAGDPHVRMGIERIMRLRQEFPAFDPIVVMDVLIGAEMDEDTARAQLQRMMHP
jgi:hypothetical protein